MTEALPLAPQSEAILRLPAVMATVGLKRTTVYDLIQRGRFPPPIKLTRCASGWRVSEVQAWLKSPSTWQASRLGVDDDQ